MLKRLFLLVILLAILSLSAVFDLSLESEFNTSSRTRCLHMSIDGDYLCYNSFHGLHIIDQDFNEFNEIPLSNIDDFQMCNNNLYTYTDHGELNSYTIDLYRNYLTNSGEYRSITFTNSSMWRMSKCNNVLLINYYDYDNHGYRTLTLDSYLAVSHIESLDDYKFLSKINNSDYILANNENNDSICMFSISSEANNTVDIIDLPDSNYYEGSLYNNILALRNQESVDFINLETNETFYNYTYDDALNSYNGIYVDETVLIFATYIDSRFKLKVVDIASGELLMYKDVNDLVNLQYMELSFLSELCQCENDLYLIANNQPLIKLQVNNDDIELVDYFNNVYSPILGTYSNENYFYHCNIPELLVTDISDPSNPVNIEHNLPDGIYQWYDINEQLTALRYNLDNGMLYHYTIENNEIVSSDSLVNLSIFQDDYMTPLDCNEERVIYKNSEGVKAVDLIDHSLMWELDYNSPVMLQAVIGDYLYVGEFMHNDYTVYQFDNESITFIQDFHTDNIEFADFYTQDEMLVVHGFEGGYCYDIRENPVPQEPILEDVITNVNSNIVSFNNSKLFVGNILQDGQELSNYLCCINEDDGNFSLIGAIPVMYEYVNVSLNYIDNTNFNIIFDGNVGSAIYSCHLTPNGNFEVQPVNLECSNYPNPFNPQTTISYNIDKASDVELTIYNIKGQKVRTLVDDQQEAGRHDIVWDGTDSKGKKVASGTYLYKVKADDQEVVNKMLMIK